MKRLVLLILLASAGLATVVGRLGRRVLGDRAPVGRQGRHAVPARPAELVEMRQSLA